MSGVKQTYITMRAEEAQRLRNQARRCDSAAAQNRILETQNRQREKREHDLRDKIGRNEQRYEQHVQRLGQDMQRMERDSRAELNRQKQDYQQGLKETARLQQQYTDQSIQQLDNKIQQDLATQRNEYRTLIQKQKKQFDHALQQQGDTLQRNIDQLQQSIKNRLHREEDIAQEWLGALQEEITYISEAFRHQQFAPGELNRLQDRLNLINGNIKQQLFQAAVSSAQEAYLQARQLREKLELQEMQWDAAWQLAQESATTALLLINEHHTIEYLLENNETFQLEVDFWSQGDWQKLQQKVDGYKQQLDNQSEPLSQADIERIQQACETAQDELLNLVDNAKAALLSSINRRDLQEIILEKLQELGYQSVDSTYEQEDFRKAFYLKVENGNHDQIVTIVTPSEQDFANQLSINFYDNSPNEAVRKERLELIQQQLADHSLEVAPMRCEKGYESGNAPPQRQDFTALRAKKQSIPVATP